MRLNTSKKLWLSLGIVILIIVLSIAHYLKQNHDTPQPIILPKKDLNISKSINLFAFDLYNQYKNKEKNIFFSPFSIEDALAIVYEGAGGETRQEMKKVLHLPNDDAKEDFSSLIKYLNSLGKIYIANALWIDKQANIYDSYTTLIKEYYDAEAYGLDMCDSSKASKTINKWVSEKTHKKIKQIIKKEYVNCETALIITNAIYFKDSWVNKFDKDKTEEKDFYITNSNSIKVKMMQLDNKDLKYWENEELKAVRLPYKRQLSMIIFLPKENNISIAEKYLTYDKFYAVINNLSSKEIEKLMIPKFKFETSYQLNDALMGMGIVSAFNRNADFSLMSSEGLQISKVVHKAYIDVNEEGTEAAAATGVIMRAAVPIEEEKKTFIADHPFLFFIIDDATKTIIFMGRVMKPEY